MKPKLWHCYNARSLRPLWTLEEMGMDYDLETLPFPPRFMSPGFKEINPLGTIPYFVDGDVNMTESSAICQYLVDRYGADDLKVTVDNPEYGDYLNWLYHSDATLTFPQTLVMRYRLLESEERRLPQVVEDYGKWFIARLRKLDAHLQGRDYLCAGRFTIADITIAYALHLGDKLGLSESYADVTRNYLDRMRQRPAFERCQAISPELDPYLFL